MTFLTIRARILLKYCFFTFFFVLEIILLAMFCMNALYIFCLLFVSVFFFLQINK